MKSMDSLLGEAVTKMGPKQLKEYRSRTKGGEPIETLVSIAETILTEVRESSSSKIARNNGGSRQLTESERSESAMQEADSLLFSGMESARSTAKGLSELVEVNGNYVRKADGTDDLSEAQRGDMEFCRLLGMSESDCLKVVTSKGGIRD